MKISGIVEELERHGIEVAYENIAIFGVCERGRVGRKTGAVAKLVFRCLLIFSGVVY